MQCNAANLHSLLAAVIDRAIADIKGAGPRCHRAEPDRAMQFILSDACEAWCLELGIDYGAIKEKAAGLYRRVLADEQPKTRRAARRSDARKNRPASYPVTVTR